MINPQRRGFHDGPKRKSSERKESQVRKSCRKINDIKRHMDSSYE